MKTLLDSEKIGGSMLTNPQAALLAAAHAGLGVERIAARSAAFLSWLDDADAAAEARREQEADKARTEHATAEREAGAQAAESHHRTLQADAEYHSCLPSLGDRCGHCHRCTDPEPKAAPAVCDSRFNPGPGIGWLKCANTEKHGSGPHYSDLVGQRYHW